MKKSINYLLLLSFLSIFFSVGCVKDNGNYDYKEVPQLSMTGFAVTIDGEPVSVYDNNTIFAKKGGLLEINYKTENWNNPTYSWTMVLAGQTTPAEGEEYLPAKEIGTAVKLSHQLAEDPGKYVILFKITSGDNTDLMKFNLSIETVKGLAILHKDATGAGDFTVLNTPELDDKLVDGQVIFENVCSQNNNGRKIQGPTFFSVDAFSKNIMIGAASTIEEYSKSTLGLVSSDYAGFFLPNQAPQVPFTPNVMVIEENGSGTSGAGFLFLNNLLYAKTRNNFGGKNKYGVVKQNETDTHNFAPLIIPGHTRIGFVDKVGFNTTRKAFQMIDNRGYGTDFWGTITTFYPKNIIGSGEVLVNDTKMDIISMGKVNSRFLCAIMKDNVGAYLMQFSFPAENETSKNIESKFITKTPLSNLTGATATSPWAYGTRGDYVYYGVGNNLFIYNLSNQKIIDCELGLPTGEIITKVNVLIDETNSAFNGAVLYVVTNNGGVGSVHQYIITPLSGKPNVGTVRTASSLGEVVDICIIK